jgi:hypothetical protein
MKHSWKAVLTAAVMLGTAQVANADLNISGATGLILNPTAQIVAKGQPEIQANYYDFGSDWDDKHYGVFGAIQAADKLEINGGVSKYRSDDEIWDRSGIAIGAKYQLFNEEQKGFALAIGAGHNRAFGRNTNAYIAATKAFGSSERASVIGTIGARWDRFDFDIDGKSSKASVFAGVQVPITRNGELSVIGEVQSKNLDNDFSGDEAKIPYALGVRYQPNGQPFSVSAGIQRHGVNTPFERKATLFVRANYAFGK